MITVRRKIQWKNWKRETTTSVDGQRQGMDEFVLCRICEKKADNRKQWRSMIVDLLRAEDT